MSNLATINLDADKVALLSRTIAKGCSADELALFTAICKRTGLDPFAKQIHAVKRWDSQLQREVMQPQVSIDGARLVAQRSGEYAGQDGPWWCGDDGAWTEVWLKAPTTPPRAAKVLVYRKGFEKPIQAVASFNEYAQRKKDGSLIQMWAKMPALMIAKCAEALALRKAFPAELGGVYVQEEVSPDDETARVENVVTMIHQQTERIKDAVAALPQDGSIVLATGEGAEVLRRAGVEVEIQGPKRDRNAITKADTTAILKALQAKEIPLSDLIVAMNKAGLDAGVDMTTWAKDWLPRVQSWIKTQRSRKAETVPDRIPDPPAEEETIPEIV